MARPTAKKRQTKSTYSSEGSGNPIAPQKTQDLIQDIMPNGKQDSDIFKDIYKQISGGQSLRGRWTAKKDLYFRMRMRIRKNKDFPFPGCSNLRMPTAEKYIRKMKAALYNVIWGIRPHAVVTPEPKGNFDISSKLEYYLDWLFEIKMKFAKKLIVLIDKMLEKGYAFAEPIWKVSYEKRTVEINLADIPTDMLQQIFSIGNDDEITDAVAKLFDVDMAESVKYENTKNLSEAIGKLRQGTKKVNLTILDETYNNVDINIHDPESVYVPADSFLDPQLARFIAVEVFEPWDIVQQKSKDGIYSEQAVSDMKAFSAIPVSDVPSQGNQSYNARRISSITEDMREGIIRVNNPSRNVKLWRTYAWYDLDGDGQEERCVFILAPEWQKVLAKFPYTYAHRKWPLIRFDAELFDDRWFSPRGIPEMIEDIIKEIDTQHNQKIDQQTIRNTPMFTFRPGVVNPRMVKFIPGSAIPVNGITPLNDAISIMNNTNSNAEFSYRDEEMLLKSEIQEMYGTQDFSLQSLINRREPPTATQIGAQQNSANQIFTMDSSIFAESMSELFLQTIQLTQQYLSDEVYFSVVGEGISVHMTREEIQGQYMVRVRGNDINTNPQTRLQMAQQKMTLLMTPYNLQSGIVTPANAYIQMKELLQELGDFSWQQKITMPQPPPPPAPPPAITQIKVPYEELTPAEKIQVLESGGIKPDPQGHMLQRQQDIATEMESQPQPTMNGTSGG